MSELTLQLDQKATDTINDLMRHYKSKNKASLISRAIMTLKLCAEIDQTDGELIARKGGKETKLILK